MDRVTRAFSKQFQYDDHGLVFRDMYSKCIYPVTEEERDAIISDYERLTDKNTFAMVSPMMVAFIIGTVGIKYPPYHVLLTVCFFILIVVMPPMLVWGALANFKARAQSLRAIKDRASTS